MNEPAPTNLLLDRFRLHAIPLKERRGYVALATDMALGRRVTLRVFGPVVANRSGARARVRLARELKILGGLTSRAAPKLYDVVDAAEWVVMVMEPIDVIPLPPQQMSDPSAAIGVALSLLDVLAEAHELGVVHRSVTPDAIGLKRLSPNRGVVKLLGWGRMTDLGHVPTLTESDIGVRIDRNWAPEVLLNDTVDQRTDVYGVGTVLYQMLSGRPVVATESERPDEVVREMLRSNRSLRLEGMDALSGWIEKALAIEPSRRFESAKVAARELAALRTGRSEPPSGVTALSPSSGTKIAERYEVIDEVGRGGMGLVLLAKDIQLERPVAIKMLDDVSPTARERLRLEGRGLGRVVSPQVVHVYDYGEHEGVPFLVMEYIEGEPLEDLLGRSPEGLPIDLLKLVVTEVARGLRAIHDVGMVHGDIKPSNVVLGKDNRVVLLDFGLVRPAVAFGGEAIPIEGSPAYMAPERIEARVEPDSAAQVDAYSFAVMMFELLSGWLPFQSGSVLEMLAHHRVKPPPAVSEHRTDLSHDVDHVLKRGMAKKVADRYPTVEDFAQALVAALNRAPLFDASLLIVSDDARARASLAHVISERLKPRALHESGVATVGFAAQKSAPNVILWAGSVNHLLASMPALQEHCSHAAIVALVDDESEHRERLRKVGVTMLVPRGSGEVLERVLLSAIRQSMRP